MKRRTGFGLVEVLISLIVLAIALMAIASTFALSSKLMIHTYEKEKAVMLASEKLDELEAGDYVGIGDLNDTSSDIVGIYTRSWKVAEEKKASGKSISKTVELEVAWDGVTEKGTSFTANREISKFAESLVLD